jgi:hypothetical protein
VSERDASRALRAVPLPDEAGAEQRGLEVADAAFRARDRVRWAHRHRGLAVAIAAAALATTVVVVAVLTPPGQAVVDRVRDAVGREEAKPALVRLPTSGHLLVVSEAGAWVVRQDGSKRLLGNYADASWSPRGLYVAAAQGQHLVALDAESGEARWSLARDRSVSEPRWSGGGLDTRIAYRAGPELHVVAGDGSPDEIIATGVGSAAAAWRGASHVLAYADAQGHVHVVDTDSSRELGVTGSGPPVRLLAFDRDGRLIVSTPKEILVYRKTLRGKPVVFARAEMDHEILAFALVGWGLVYADYDRAADATTIVRPLCSTAGACLAILNPDVDLFRGAGRVDGLTASPGGRWLVSGWPAADQLLFLRLLPRIGKAVGVSNATDEFSPGSSRGAFPVVMGWVP